MPTEQLEVSVWGGKEQLPRTAAAAKRRAGLDGSSPFTPLCSDGCAVVGGNLE